MALKSSIEWTESTWNPITGCTKISPGCKFCYAERMAKRLKAMGSANYENGFKLTLQDHVVELPLTWKKPQTIFVNSMSDLFHKNVPFEFIQRIFEVMNKAYWHKFQVLTKRSDILLKYNSKLNWTENIWMGVSVENDDYTYRINDLRNTDAKTKFLSIEPLIGPINILDLTNIDWVIVGGESGPGARPVKEEWVIDIKDKCIDQNVPFFFKQWGGVQKKKAGRLLQGKTWSQMPEYRKAG
ncbi:MAG: phage Gp37/Gp68 family protein [Ignavibacteriaceae bacterium]